MSEQRKYLLDESRLPKAWYNINADLPYEPAPVLHPQTLEPVTPTTNVVDHGLFVAGLVHAIAPESKIELIQVLNRRGCGDLQTLNKSLMQFIAEKHRERGLRAIAINVGESPQLAIPFAEDMGLTMPIGVYQERIRERISKEGRAAFSSFFEQTNVRSKIVGVFLAMASAGIRFLVRNPGSLMLLANSQRLTTSPSERQMARISIRPSPR